MATDRVSVWVALGAAVTRVTLTVYTHTTVSTNMIKGTADFTPVQIGAKLFIAVPTVTFGDGARLDPNTIYEYNLEFDDQTLGSLGFLSETPIGPQKHRNLPLGYAEGKLPSFVTPPATAEELVIAHGSCRRPYAEGTDAIVAVDQIIGRSVENPGRPHFLFLTGDQIYADDLSEELLGWANDVGVELIGKNGDHALEQLRVNVPVVPYDENPAPPATTDFDTETTEVRFPADRLHFPPGRRARLCSRAAALTSDDNRNHALSFGEIAAHYVMSWSNVAWTKNLEDAATWKSLYEERGIYVRSYLDAWADNVSKAKQHWAEHIAADPNYKLDAKAHLAERLQRVDAYCLLPSEYRGIDDEALGMRATSAVHPDRCDDAQHEQTSPRPPRSIFVRRPNVLHVQCIGRR